MRRRETKRLLIIAIALLLSLSAAAAEQRCPLASDISALRTELQFALNGDVDLASCDPSSKGSRLREALLLMKSESFTSTQKLAGPFNQDLLQTGFWTYFISRIKKISDSSMSDPHCIGKFAAYVVQNGSDQAVDHSLHLCGLFYHDEINVYGRIQFLLHEARHIEGFPHVTCTQGNNTGLAGGCDERIEDHGSYAVTVEALTRMAVDKKTSAVDRAQNKSLALIYAANEFNEPVKSAHPSAIYLRSKDGHGFIFDSDELFPAPAILNKGTVVGLTDSLEVYPGAQQPAMVIDPWTMKPSSAHHTASDYFNSGKSQFVPTSLSSAGLYVVVLSNRLAILPTGAGAFTQVPLPWQPVAAFLPEELGLSPSAAIYILNASHALFEVNYSQSTELVSVENSAQGFQSLIVMDGVRYGLTDQGQLVKMKNGAWAPLIKLQGRTFSVLTRPFEWSSYFSAGQ